MLAGSHDLPKSRSTSFPVALRTVDPLPFARTTCERSSSRRRLFSNPVSTPVGTDFFLSFFLAQVLHLYYYYYYLGECLLFVARNFVKYLLLIIDIIVTVRRF